jgi:hypothetical protein
MGGFRDFQCNDRCSLFPRARKIKGSIEIEKIISKMSFYVSSG